MSYVICKVTYVITTEKSLPTTMAEETCTLLHYLVCKRSHKMLRWMMQLLNKMAVEQPDHSYTKHSASEN